jgi:hypothetical protein
MEFIRRPNSHLGLDERRPPSDVVAIVKKLFVLLISILLPAIARAADPEATCRMKVASVLPNVRNLVIENETVTAIRDRPADPDSRYFLVDVDFKAVGATEHRRYVCLGDNRGNAFLRGVALPPAEQPPSDDSAAASAKADESLGLR